MARRSIIWSPRAKIDQFEILDFFYKKNGNKNYSKKLNSEFKEAIKLISRHTDIGLRTDIQNVRSIIVGNYSIFYRINKKTIEILTIWDSRQDPHKLAIK